MPGVDQTSVDEMLRDAREAADARRRRRAAVRDSRSRRTRSGSEAWNDDAPVQQAVRALKRELPKLVVITDVCLCEYTDHGHCGVIRDGDVDNDATLELLAREAVSHARAGADIVAPSDMMDGRVGGDSRALDDEWLRGHGDPELRGEVRRSVLRSVSRGRRVDAAVRRSAQLSDGFGELATRRCAKSRSTSRRARTW